MDTQTASPPTPPPAPVIGNAFVEQYYHILHYSPELVHRFYQESSILSRPEPNGVMTSVTTTEVSLFGLSTLFMAEFVILSSCLMQQLTEKIAIKKHMVFCSQINGLMESRELCCVHRERRPKVH